MDPRPDIARSKKTGKQSSKNASGPYRKQTHQKLKTQARDVSISGIDRDHCHWNSCFTTDLRMADTLTWNNDNPLQISQHQSSVNEKPTAKRSLALAPYDAGWLTKRWCRGRGRCVRGCQAQARIRHGAMPQGSASLSPHADPARLGVVAQGVVEQNIQPRCSGPPHEHRGSHPTNSRQRNTANASSGSPRKRSSHASPVGSTTATPTSTPRPS